MKVFVISKNLTYTFDILFFQHVEVMARYMYSEFHQIGINLRAYHKFKWSPDTLN